MQKLEIKLIERKVAKEKLTDGQSNLLFSNQVHAMDGAIDLCDADCVSYAARHLPQPIYRTQVFDYG